MQEKISKAPLWGYQISKDAQSPTDIPARQLQPLRSYYNTPLISQAPLRSDIDAQLPTDSSLRSDQIKACCMHSSGTLSRHSKTPRHGASSARNPCMTHTCHTHCCPKAAAGPVAVSLTLDDPGKEHQGVETLREGTTDRTGKHGGPVCSTK
jgi:hypothetical protein